MSRSNVAIAREYLAALSSGAAPHELDRFYAPDVVQQEFPNRLMPNGAIRDLNALREGRVRGLALLQSESFDVQNVVDGGDTVVLEVIWTGVVKNAAGPFSAGQTLRAHFAVFLEFRDGRIAKQRNYDCFDAW